MQLVTVTEKNYGHFLKQLGLDLIDGYNMIGYKFQDSPSFIIDLETYQRKADALIEERRAKLQARVDEKWAKTGTRTPVLGLDENATPEQLLDLISDARKFYHPVDMSAAPKVEMINSGEFTVSGSPLKPITGD